MRIFLIGFMGSGKSTIGRKLSEALDCPFVDLDEFIEKYAGKTISELFAISQTHFRYLEYNALQKVIELHPGAVIALGGGTPCYFNNMTRILGSGKSLYLRVSPEVLLDRLKEDATRPLLQDKTKDELLEYISRTLSGREGYYLRAHEVVDGDQDVEKLIDKIQSLC